LGVDLETMNAIVLLAAMKITAIGPSFFSADASKNQPMHLILIWQRGNLVPFHVKLLDYPSGYTRVCLTN
jgi:hypothetical protein